MNDEITIYLAGKIHKGHENTEETYWTEKDIHVLKMALMPYSALFLNPADRSDDLSDQLSVFGRDMLQVFSSQFVFVDARDRRGLGVGAEMMWAKINHLPVITWAPRESHYRKSSTSLLGQPVLNWIHPFVASLSDLVVEDLQEAALWIQEIKKGKVYSIKGFNHMVVAMQHYLRHQWDSDSPLRELVQESTVLQLRIEQARGACEYVISDKIENIRGPSFSILQ